jgi:UDP-N-acetylmuramate dehydrogenase
MLDKIEGIKKNVPLAQLTTFQMGGPADYYYELTDVMKVPEVLEACRHDGLPYFLLAWGSNVLFSDKGFRGLVIRNLARHCQVGEPVEAVGEPGGEGYRPASRLVEADSGTLLSQVIQLALKNGLTGMEKLMGIPGTIGGAVRGNAGAFGLEIQSLFEKALVYTPETAQLHEIDRSGMNFTYRHSSLKENHDILLKIALRLTPGDSAAASEEVRQILTYRAGRHPQGYSAGSFFKNPSRNSIGEGHSAGQLIEACGFKGEKVGGAYISDKHANFLMNDGTASMLDVLELYTRIQEAVWKKFGIHLEREVLLVGEHEYVEDVFRAE